MSKTTVSPEVKSAAALPGGGGKSNEMSYFPSPSAMKAFVPVEIVATDPGVPTEANVSCVGSLAGLKLKSQSSTFSLPTRLAADMVIRTSFGPPTESSKVAVMNGGVPPGVVPPLNSTVKPMFRIVAPATDDVPRAAATARTARHELYPVQRCG